MAGRVVACRGAETYAPGDSSELPALGCDLCGPEDDWGAQDVESPHVRIIDVHPMKHSGGVVILNEYVVPAFVTAKVSLLRQDGSAIAIEDAFDKISHVLLHKQVSPFRIDFRGVSMSQVDSVRMRPSASLIAASARPSS